MKYIDELNAEIKKEKKMTDFNPLISVIIPVYNSEKYLKECLDSVITQTYQNLEVICVDDGSTDHSLEILNFYEKKDSRIKVLTQKNAGPSAARNKALDVASGEYISFVDSDDFLQANAYEILTECAGQKESWDLIIFGGNVVGQENRYFEEKLTTNFRKYLNCQPGSVVFGEKAARPFLWLHFIKRELLEKPEKIRFPEDINLGEDQICQFEYIPRAKNVMVIDQKLYNYRISNNASIMQLYNNRKIKKTECHFTIIERVMQNWKRDGYYELYKDDLWTWAVELMYWTINEFPVELKKEYSVRMLDLMKKYDADVYLIAGREMEHYKTFIEWSMDNRTAQDELAMLQKKIAQEKFEIEETLKSKAFKAGRFFTKKEKRIDTNNLI